MDEIAIDKIRVSGKHGCYAEERNESRDFEVSLRLFLPLNRAAKTDELSHTIDYPQAMAVVEGVFAGESIRLIEKLADMVAERLFVRFEMLREVEITLAKLGVDVGFDFGGVSVRIRRKREDYIGGCND